MSDDTSNDLKRLGINVPERLAGRLREAALRAGYLNLSDWVRRVLQDEADRLLDPPARAAGGAS